MALSEPQGVQEEKKVVHCIRGCSKSPFGAAAVSERLKHILRRHVQILSEI